MHTSIANGSTRAQLTVITINSQATLRSSAALYAAQVVPVDCRLKCTKPAVAERTAHIIDCNWDLLEAYVEGDMPAEGMQSLCEVFLQEKNHIAVRIRCLALVLYWTARHRSIARGLWVAAHQVGVYTHA